MLLLSTKVSYYNQRIMTGKSDVPDNNEPSIWQIVSKLPEHSSAEELANRFSCFFKEKIARKSGITSLTALTST